MMNKGRKVNLLGPFCFLDTWIQPLEPTGLTLLRGFPREREHLKKNSRTGGFIFIVR